MTKKKKKWKMKFISDQTVEYMVKILESIEFNLILEHEPYSDIDNNFTYYFIFKNTRCIEIKMIKLK